MTQLIVAQQSCFVSGFGQSEWLLFDQCRVVKSPFHLILVDQDLLFPGQTFLWIDISIISVEIHLYEKKNMIGYRNIMIDLLMSDSLIQFSTRSGSNRQISRVLILARYFSTDLSYLVAAMHSELEGCSTTIQQLEHYRHSSSRAQEKKGSLYFWNNSTSFWWTSTDCKFSFVSSSK